MLPDDDRHGTTRGFHAGCQEACCRAAIARYQKTIRNNSFQGLRLSVPAIGAQRRIQGLMALGWTGNDIAEAGDLGHRNYLWRVLGGQKGKPCTWIERSTHERICAVYDLLSMKAPEMTGYRSRCRTMALKRGWLPPLSWDDESLDDPAASPHKMETSIYKFTNLRGEMDPVVVERFLAGDTTLKPNLAEKREIVRRWPRSLAELERMGWNPHRYIDSKDVA